MYQSLAAVYDRLSKIDHNNWADFLEHIFSSAGRPVKKVLDLACGTGSMSLELAKRGYQVTGADVSEDMLAVAEAKLRNYSVPLFKADMLELPPLGKFDAVICLSDSLNYLTGPEELERVFSELHKVSPDVLIFDLNTPYYLAQVLGNNTFHHVEEDIAYFWENTFTSDKSEMQITFFVRTEGEMFKRFAEVHEETAFELAQVQDILNRSGWQLINVYDGYSTSPAREDSQRWLFVAIPGKNTGKNANSGKNT